jgi:hypothetical protein
MPATALPTVTGGVPRHSAVMVAFETLGPEYESTGGAPRFDFAVADRRMTIGARVEQCKGGSS